ncbi:hypothetical protein [Planctomicrobium piriforme]|nr:hypothetical protein [Planctomicrobium piriforme]
MKPMLLSLFVLGLMLQPQSSAVFAQQVAVIINKVEESLEGIPELPAIRVTTVTQNHAADDLIRKVLAQSQSFDFAEAPLHDVVNFLSQQHAINVLLDQSALAEEGISSDTQVTFALPNVTLGTGLRLLLENVEGAPLAYYVDGEVLMVTTRSAADQKKQTRIYGVNALMEETSIEELTEAINVTVIEPAAEEGVHATVTTVGEQLIVKAPQRVQDEVETFLNSLLRQLSP